MSTLFSKTSVVDELAARLAAQRARTARRSGAYRRLALAILDSAVLTRTGQPVELKTVQQPVAAA